MPSTRYQKINTHHYRHIWVVGDIHGEYQLLQSRLHQLSFFPETDLLISVGDNIDRGPESLDVLRLLNQPWFISVKGNHEAMRWMRSRPAMAICGLPAVVTGFSI